MNWLKSKKPNTFHIKQSAIWHNTTCDKAKDSCLHRPNTARKTVNLFSNVAHSPQCQRPELSVVHKKGGMFQATLRSFWVWVEVLRPIGISGHLQGENIQSYNLFSPVMMIIWWMKLGRDLPPGPNALLFSITHGIFYIIMSSRTATVTLRIVYLPFRWKSQDFGV